MKKWKFKEHVQFLEEVSELLKNGYHLQDTLEIGKSLHNGKQKELYGLLQESCNKGESLSQALSNQSFPTWMMSFLRVSEEKGEITQGLYRVSLMGKSILNAKKYFLKQVQYPLFLFGSLLLLLLFFQFIFYPQLSIQMNSIGFSYPSYVSYVITLLLAFPYLFLFFLLVISILLLLLVRQYAHQGMLWRQIDKRGSWVKGRIKNVTTYLFALYIGELLNGGISLLISLSFLKKTILKPILHHDISILLKGLEEGYSMKQNLVKTNWISNKLMWSIEYGELKGELSEELLRYTNRWIMLKKTKMEKMLKIFSTVVFLYIAICIAFLYVLIFFPLYKGMLEVV